MKQWILLVGLLFVAVAAAKVAKHKSHREQALQEEDRVEEEIVQEQPKRRQRPTVLKDTEVPEEQPHIEVHSEQEVQQKSPVVQEESQEEAPVVQKEAVVEEESVEETPVKPPVRVEVEEIIEVQLPSPKKPPKEHPCNTHHCGKGKECVLDKEEKAKCICTKKCGVEKDKRFKVCTKMNDTMDSLCEMERQVCLCKKREEGCVNPHFRNAELDYYGPCKDMDSEAKACTKFEKEQFPIRMRKWLYIVMEELAERSDMAQQSKKMARKAEHMKTSNKKDTTRKWIIPVMWKFCDLDISHDDVVEPLEHLAISAPLKPLEHCFAPFLQECDADNDDNITKNEWVQCLKLNPEEVNELSVRCEEFRSDE